MRLPAVVAALVFVSCAVCGTGLAATPRLATNLPGAMSALPPPPGFDPLTASDQSLDLYGFPPRPDPAAAPDAYAEWLRVVSRGLNRAQPHLSQTKLKHAPAVVANSMAATTSFASYNWSGIAKTKGVGPNSPPFSSVTAEYVVPRAVNAPCDGGTDYTSAWVGLDGWNSNDVLQAGTESDASCHGVSTTSIYYAWYEWYPSYETAIDPGTFPVSAGDNLSVTVWNTSPAVGHAYLVNLNTGLSVSLQFNAPAGTSLKGNSAEWIVERPMVGNVLANLADYARDYFSGASAQYSTTTIVPKQGSAVSMVNNSDTVLISVPALLGSNAILFTYH